jgi:hypothetical protein
VRVCVNACERDRGGVCACEQVSENESERVCGMSVCMRVRAFGQVLFQTRPAHKGCRDHLVY